MTARALHAVVLAGGRGRRLEEYARRFAACPAPKQFHTFGMAKTLLQQTMDRIEPLVDSENTVVVVDRTQKDRATEQLQAYRGVQVVSQPCDRGTGPGVLIGLAEVLARDSDADVLIVPSDHGVRNEALFRSDVETARRDVGVCADIVALGVVPSDARTDFGWILPGAALSGTLRRVARFVEKPKRVDAQQLWASGALWNTMLTVARGRALWDQYAEHLPGTAFIFEVAHRFGQADRERYLERRYPHIPKSDFCRDVLEATQELATGRLSSGVGWTDLGTPNRMAAWLSENAENVFLA